MCHCFVILIANQKIRMYNGDSLIEVLRILLRKTLLKKGSSSYSFPKTFSFNVSHIWCISEEIKLSQQNDTHPMGLKLALKVFGRGDGGDSPQCGEMSEGQRGPPLLAEPFLRKVSPDICI